MKRFIGTIAIIVCLLVSVTAFSACSDHGAPEGNSIPADYAVSPTDMADELEMFMTECGDDRTTFTARELQAARYLQARLIEMGYTDALMQDFTVSENNVSDLESRNVIAKYRNSAGKTDAKNVVLGAYYDNRYSSAYKNAVAYKSAGALANGTGVATLLQIASYLQSSGSELDFDVTLVFFGASYISDDGARLYYRDGMTQEERAATVLMVELQRLGVDHVYAFSDARKTKREEFFERISAENGLNIYKSTSKSPLLTNAYALNGIPYYQWAQTGVFGSFFNNGIPTLNLVGANWETIDMTDTESAEYDNISFTESDNLDNLKKLYPDYADKMSAAATLILKAFGSPDFLPVMTYDREHFPDTDVLTKAWIWYLVAFGVIVIALVAMYFVYARLVKKYPPAAIRPKQMKMAVFGMDYEDKDSGNIFIDIKSAPIDDIFPGIPNNEKTADPFDDIFPPVSAPQPNPDITEKTEDKSDKDGGGKGENGDDGENKS